MIRLLLFALSVIAAISTAAIAQIEDEEPEMALLPIGEGRDDVFYLCSACHSIKTVVQQRLSRDVWDETLDWMVEEQGMPALEEEERQQILEYLSTYVSPDK